MVVGYSQGGSAAPVATRALRSVAGWLRLMAFEREQLHSVLAVRDHCPAAAEHTAPTDGTSNQLRMMRTARSEQTHAPRSGFAVDGAGGET